ncbi:MAG: protein TolQ [Alphaproteobacteria bacterium]|nr:protein TolQ [Alphaproteobacteria bacterium]
MDIVGFAPAHEALWLLGALADTLSAAADVASAVQAPSAAPVDPASAIPLTPIGEAAGGAAKAGAEAIDMSPMALFMKADIVVKSVMGILLLLSVWSWAIIIGKWARLSTVRSQADRFEQTFWSGRSLDDVFTSLQARQDHHPMAQVFVAAMREWKRSFESGPVNTGLLPSVKDRINKVMNVTIGRELTRLESSLGFLATVGVNATFIGLFGTVWGIMNSFRQIAASHDTSLAVVAPGIAEALFATAMGLVAAIPASIAYNHLSSSVNRIAARLEGFAEEFSAILSRQLDEKAR